MPIGPSLKSCTYFPCKLVCGIPRSGRTLLLGLNHVNHTFFFRHILIENSLSNLCCQYQYPKVHKSFSDDHLLGRSLSYENRRP